jgi:hypothetical protein
MIARPTAHWRVDGREQHACRSDPPSRTGLRVRQVVQRLSRLICRAPETVAP